MLNLMFPLTFILGGGKMTVANFLKGEHQSFNVTLFHIQNF